MIKVSEIEVDGFEHAIRAMRNPMNSHHLSDSSWCEDFQNPKEHPEDCVGCPAYYDDKCHGVLPEEKKKQLIQYNIGERDFKLMKNLYSGGTEHRTYARMIQVWMDIEAGLYWWKEMDRYCVGKSQVSTSTMHKIHAKEFTLNDFSHEHLSESAIKCLEYTISELNSAREMYLETKDKKWWWDMIQLLPTSYNQKRTINMSYEVVFKIIRERTGHKLDEWNEFVDILKNLPYVEDIMNEG